MHNSMQQLYRCWSWWESNPTLPPLLVWKDYQIFLHQYNVQYVITFLTVLQQSYNLTIVDPLLNTTPNRILNRKNMVRSKNTGLFSNDIDITDYAMLSSYHAYSLQQLFYNYIQSTANLTTRPAIQSGGCRTDRSEPNISILNRRTQSKRSILNSQVIAAQIQQLYPNSIVRVEYFENTTMLQQVQFFMESDIILSPHGAQLTGILYQPITASSSSRTSSCSQILELIPQDYLVADFFGSLAKVAGIQHSFFYVQPPMNTTNINDEGYNNAIDRTSSLINESNTTTDVLPDGKYKYHYFKSTQYRNDPFCPDVTIIVNAVKRMVDQWKTCCSKHLSS